MATNERLNIESHSLPKYEWTITNLPKYIQFVIQWNGLKMKQIKNCPTSYEEYERKARNWLNGRRAPNYAQTLFPDLIKSSENYAELISTQLFGKNNQFQSAYHYILMYGYLHCLCSVRISMNDISKKTLLLCENSIKSNSATSVLLQQYATDHPFAQYFPSHLKQAADYFLSKFEFEIERFGDALRLNQSLNMNQFKVTTMGYAQYLTMPTPPQQQQQIYLNQSHPEKPKTDITSSPISSSSILSNLSIPPLVAQPLSSPVAEKHVQPKINGNKLEGMTVNVGGKDQSVVSFINQIVNTCNNQQIFMQSLQHRVNSLEQIIKNYALTPQINMTHQQIQPMPLPTVQSINSVILPTMNQRQFILQKQTIPAPTMTTTNLIMDETKIKSKNEGNKSDDDDHAAALLLASLKHHKMPRNAENESPPMKRRKIQKNNENEAANGRYSKQQKK